MKKLVRAIAKPFVGIAQIYAELWKMWKESADWDNQSPKHKWYIIWFGLSFCGIFLFAESWLIVPAIANFAWSSRVVTKNVNIQDE